MAEDTNYFTDTATMAEQVAAIKCEDRILLVLYEFDQVNASVANELVRLHGSDHIIERHNAAWDGLKKLIWELEQGKDRT